MTLTIVTGMWGPKRNNYADTFLPGLRKWWPSEVGLQLGLDEPLARLLEPGRAGRIHWLHEDPGYRGFMDRHAGDPVACGARPAPGATWKPKCLRLGYNFRFDAVRFAGQAFVPALAARWMLDGEVLCWLDADVVTHAQVPADFIEGLIGDADGAYLGRHAKHSEIGFWAVRLSERTRGMLTAFSAAYLNDGAFDLKEWHSAYVWDDARRWAEDTLGVRMRNLTPGGQGHVWHQSPLAQYMDHLKGDRKAKGRSPERRG